MLRTIHSTVLALLLAGSLSALSAPQRANLDTSAAGGAAAPALEPMTLSLIGIGGIGLTYVLRRRRGPAEE